MQAGAAAFCVYFCMYAFRKPFTAGTYDDLSAFGLELKSVLVTSQLLGYMASKFIGIKVVSEMRSEYRAYAILGLIAFAELALVGFALAPIPVKIVMLFLNGLPLGMVFGLVLGYLEGRRQTEALSAALCASFIASSGAVKTVGRMVIAQGFSEFQMPMITGALFIVPLLVSVWILQMTPPPNSEDRRLRSERTAMSRSQRNAFLAAYWPGLSLLVMVYVALTIVRTARDDFGVELWRDMGVDEPSVFAWSETIVSVVVMSLTAFMMLIAHNLTAIRTCVGLMAMGFAVVVGSVFTQESGIASPYTFMVACGVGLYVPYVAFHTTIFERLIALSSRPSNLGFLMYVADAVGYLGYAVIILLRNVIQPDGEILPFFRTAMLVVAACSILCLVGAQIYFERVLAAERPFQPDAEPTT